MTHWKSQWLDSLERMVIIGKARRALRRAGYSKEYVEKFTKEATSGDYNHVLQTVMNYVEVE